jgi:predicted AAA+ superfamily ATPase
MQRPKNWNQALEVLTSLINNKKEKKIIIFIDELPWLASQRSNFLSALDYSWNQSWSKDTRIKLIVCGSAASWMNENLIQATGGLHNRLTRQMLLSPFHFREVKEYAHDQKLKLIDGELLKLYMVIGGVPYYWSLIPKGQSSAQIIDFLFFKKDAELKLEFSRLFKSLFDNHQVYEKIVRVLASSKKGMNRNELLAKVNIKTGGTANKYLNCLEHSGFIESFIPFGNKKKNISYRLIDEFSLFHIYWEGAHSSLNSFWTNEQSSPKVNTWAGYAFENFCFQHKNEIAKALGIEQLITGAYSWRYAPKKENKNERGAQVDFLFTRKDECLNLIELKYSKKIFSLEKAYAKELAEKVEIFKTKSKFKGQIFTTLVSPLGVKPGLWDDEVLDSTLSLETIMKAD